MVALVSPKGAGPESGTEETPDIQMAKHLGVDLIILGSRGLTGLKHLLLGSTAERVFQHARWPVLVVEEP